MLQYEKVKEKQAFKTMTSKEKKDHIMEYYKWHIIGVICTIFLIGSALNHYVFNPPKVASCNVLMLGDYVEADKMSEMEIIFNQENPDLLNDREEIQFNQIAYGFSDQDVQLRMASQQKFMAMIAGQQVDILIGEKQYLREFAEYGGCLDLNEVLTEEQLKTYEGKLLKYSYMEKDENDNVITHEPKNYVIDISEIKALNDLVYGDELGVAIVVNGEKQEAAETLLNSILDKFNK